MDNISVDPEPASTPRPVRRHLKRAWIFRENGNDPYSPVLCLSLLLTVGLLIIGL
jgi:hypothetical protein